MRLLKILFLKIRVILEKLQSVRICRQDFEHAPDGDPHPADAGLTAHLAGLDRDPVEWRIEAHTIIMTHPDPFIRSSAPVRASNWARGLANRASSAAEGGRAANGLADSPNCGCFTAGIARGSARL